ncbi:MAG TPA: hypothetical protein VIN96_05415 [Magnetovibrio sp.]
MICCTFKKFRNNELEAFFGEQVLFELVKDQFIQFFHTHVPSLTGGLTFRCPCVAGVVAIASSFACAERHAAPTGAALGNSSKERRAIHNAWRGIAGTAFRKQVLHALKGVVGDDDGRVERYPLARVFGLARLAIRFVEVVDTHIGGVGQYFVDQTDAKITSLTISKTFSIQRMGYGANAFAFETQGEDVANNRRFVLFDLKFLFCDPTANFDGNSLVSIRGMGTVPIPLTGIFLH